MNYVTFSTIILGVGCGFGAAVWLSVAVWHFRHNSNHIGFWYTVLAMTYLACTVIIAGRFFGYFTELRRGTTLLLLGPILAIPPAIQWATWLRARSLVKETLDSARELHGG